MKTTEIVAYIENRNVRLFVGIDRPLLPLPPIHVRTRSQVGWFAYQLIQCAVLQQGSVFLHNPKLGAFGFFGINDWADMMKDEENAWERVQFDGYGEVLSWKEVGI